MIKKKLIHFNTYSAFEESKSQLYDWTIAFIKETKQIYTHQTFYDCDIEDINELNDKIDEILADIYVEIEVPNGVYIQAIDGQLYTEADWDGSKTPNGIAVVTDNCEFVMALQDAHSSSCQFGGYGTEVSGITTTTSSSTAATDYDGNGNTTTIINALNGTNDGYVDGAPAAEYCRAYTFSNGATGYMGAAGEWQAALDNMSAVASALSACGGTAMSNWYWTSTQCSSNLSWHVPWYDEYLNPDRKDRTSYVRAFAALPTKQSLKDKLAELEQSLSIKGNIQAVDTTESVDDPNITYLTTSQQSFTDSEKIQVKENLDIEDYDLSEYAKKTTIVEHDTSETTFELTPNTFHKWGEVASLSLTLAEPSDTSAYNEYMFEFTSGDTATTLTLPDTISLVYFPEVTVNMIYQCSIVNNVGIIVSSYKE